MPVEIVGDIHFTGEEAAERIGCVGDGDDIGRKNFLKRLFGKKTKKKARKMKRQQALQETPADFEKASPAEPPAGTAPAEAAESEETETGWGSTLDSELFDRSHHDVWKRHAIVGGGGRRSRL